MEDAKVITLEQVVEHTLDAPASPPASPSSKKRKNRHRKSVLWTVYKMAPPGVQRGTQVLDT